MSAALLVSLGAPCAGWACWDGYGATVGRASATMQPEATWTPEVARDAAQWLTRIDALLPPDTSVEIYPWAITCEGPACRDGSIDFRGDYPDAFAAVAMLVGATPDRVAAARLRASVPVTVQVFAGSEHGARAVAEKIATQESEDWTGFYVAGGFPASHPTAHVVRAALPDGSVTYRVLVGAYLDTTRAAPTLAALAALGIRGFVRPLAGAGEPIEFYPERGG